MPLPKKQTSQDSSIDKLEKKSNEQLNKESSGEKPSASTNGFSFKKDLVSPSKNSLTRNKPGPISEAANEISQENNNNNNNNSKTIDLMLLPQIVVVVVVLLLLLMVNQNPME